MIRSGAAAPLSPDDYALQLDVYRGDLPGVAIRPCRGDMRYYYAGDGKSLAGAFVIAITDGGDVVDFWAQPRKIPIRMSPLEYLDGIANAVHALAQRGWDGESQALVFGAVCDYLTSIGVVGA